jgi:hypothetical protein
MKLRSLSNAKVRRVLIALICLALGSFALGTILFRPGTLWVYPRGRIVLRGDAKDSQTFVFWNPHPYPISLVPAPGCSCTLVDFPATISPFSFSRGTLVMDFSGTPLGPARKDLEIVLQGKNEDGLLYIPVTAIREVKK